MTLDELLTQLMKIKETFPDSGKYKVMLYNTGRTFEHHGRFESHTIKKVLNHDELVIK